jgi:hypothetical protein
MRIQLGTKPVTRRDMEELRSILVDLQGQLNSITERIPQARQTDVSSNASNRSWSFSRSPTESLNIDTTLPGDAAPTCTEQYHTPVLVNFHKWARIILGLYADKVSRDFRIWAVESRLPSDPGILRCIPTISQKREEPNMASRETKVWYIVLTL